ncbi:MAG TPA: M1 family aminopeptidase [Vicinamibacterales bacterium]|nr:M1 family aminopeptidase [Vicinamibacterales bacterium]
MLVRLLFLVALSVSPALAGQVSPRATDPEDDSIQAFLQAVETSISTMDRARWIELLAPSADRDQALEFYDAMVPQGITRVVVKERDRSPLAGSLPGEGFQLVVEVFMETGARGRIATWRLDIRRPRGDDVGRQPWRILSEDRLASIEGLHRLSMHPEKQFAAKNLVLRAVDFELRLPSGDVFVAETPEGVTAMVLLGEGTMVFQPLPKEERGQLKLFAGTETLETQFTSAFVRLSPFEFEQRLAKSMLEPVALDSRTYRRAQNQFDDNLPKSFNLDLSDLSRDTWSLLPQPGDFVAEVDTRRFDNMTYARSSGEAEDVSLFQRERKRKISEYASEQKLQSRGRFFDEDDLVDFDVIDYDVDTSFFPDREWMDGRTRIKLRVKSQGIGVITLRFAESLNVSSVMSEEFGRLLFLRVRNQNSLLVNLPQPVARDFPMTLTVTYSGRLTRQSILDESLTLLQQRNAQPDDVPYVPAEPKWLFSNRNYWYPQNQVTDYASARIRVTVPIEYSVIASGVPEPGSPFTAAAAPIEGSSRTIPRAAYSFVAPQPVRYLGFIVSRMSRVESATVALDIVPVKTSAPDMKGADTLAQQVNRLNAAVAVPAVGARNTVRLNVEANRRQETRGRDAVNNAAEIIRLYSSLTGDVPYDSITLAMVEDEVPGGHAPGYFAMLNNPPPVQPFSFRNDPASFQNFPEFFLAHELAHQWFGQAVGWKNHHEQWLSEGFAQYFAALYARDKRGEPAFRDVLRQFRKWAVEDSDQGPVYLGYRLGHIKGEPRVFRSLVYNKGAAVLHMLRRVIGDEAFFAGLKTFYADYRFKKAGSDDLRRAMEKTSKRDLQRFFERWIYDNGIPRLRYSTAVEGSDLIVRFEQSGDIYDVPVTMAVTYSDGKTAEFVMVVTDATSEGRFPLTGTVRSIEANPDGASLALIEKSSK